jgi:hypothetical protein
LSYVGDISCDVNGSGVIGGDPLAVVTLGSTEGDRETAGEQLTSFKSFEKVVTLRHDDLPKKALVCYPNGSASLIGAKNATYKF